MKKLIILILLLIPLVNAQLDSYPYPFVKNNQFNFQGVYGEKSPGSDIAAFSDIFAGLAVNAPTDKPKSLMNPNELLDYNQNLIILGNPCDNSLVKSYLNYDNCKEFPYDKGEAIIKLIQKDKKSILIVSGATPDDTLMAAKVLSNYIDYALKGDFIVVKGSISSLKLEYPEEKSKRLDYCGNNRIDVFGEICDGLDDSTCPGLCFENCTCGKKVALTTTTLLKESTTTTIKQIEEKIGFWKKLKLFLKKIFS